METYAEATRLRTSLGTFGRLLEWPFEASGWIGDEFDDNDMACKGPPSTDFDEPVALTLALIDDGRRFVAAALRAIFQDVGGACLAASHRRRKFRLLTAN